MKTNKIFTIIMVILIICIIALAFSPKTEDDTIIEYYALTTCIVEVDRNNDIVVCEDGNGNLWEFYGCEDWEIGDCASLLMNNCGTITIYDDEIETARYNLWPNI